MYSRGYSFQWGDSSGEQHTWFVVSDENQERDKVIAVNISSYNAEKKGLDKTCVIKPSDVSGMNNRIRNESYVVYRMCQILEHSKIEEILAQHTERNSRIPAWVVDKMAAGLLLSNATPERVKRFYREIKTPTKTKG